MYPGISYQKKLTKGGIFFLFMLCLVFGFQSANAQCTTPLSLFATNSAVNCISSTASATVQCFNCTGAVSYTWLPTGGNGSVANSLAPNSYTILAKDALGCTGSTNLIILNNTGIQVLMSTVPPACVGPGTGTVTANVTGPASFPLTYSWTPSAPNSSVITGPPGNYSVVVTDNVGCTFTGTTTLTAPTTITASINFTPIKCNGGLTSATVNASGGVGTLTYSWAPISATTSVVNNLAPNIYSCTVKDGSGCVNTLTANITQPAPIQNTLTLVHATCNTFTNGQASSNLSGGTPAYSYTWLPVNAFASSVSGLSVGNYTLLVKDSKLCTFTQTFSINQPPPITFTVTHKDEFCINADGTATLNVGGGNGPYTYSWSTTPVQTTSVATGLAAGTYSYFVTDANNCKASGAVTIGNTSTMTATIPTKTDVSCNGLCNGTATAGISGGSGPYSYQWIGIPTATLSGITGLCPGQYTVKVTDNTGCYTTATTTINEPPPLSYSISGANILCYGQSSTLSGSVTGGSPGYTYNWQPGSLNGVSVTVTPTVTTGYTLTVTDSKGCIGAPKVYSVNVNPPITISPGANSFTVCPNVTTSVVVNPLGGDGLYTYVWMPGNITTNSISVNLQNTTTYTVTIKDGCGSTPATTTVSINVFQIQNPSFTTSSTKGCETFCTQFSNTSTGTTTALWNFGDFSPPVQSPVVTHCYDRPGTYSVSLTITNELGCKFTLIKPNLITVYGKPIADFVQTPEKIDLNTNEASFENASVNASQFSWSINGNPVSSQPNFNYVFTLEGCYTVQLVAYNAGSNEGGSCRDTTSKEICVTEGYNFFIPNAFSPDLDTHNDYFYPKGTGWVGTDYSFEIYNRWGELIFKTTDITGAWDGTYGGMRATDEIYVWRVFVRDIYDYEHEYRGHVLIMR